MFIAKGKMIFVVAVVALPSQSLAFLFSLCVAVVLFIFITFCFPIFCYFSVCSFVLSSE